MKETKPRKQTNKKFIRKNVIKLNAYIWVNLNKYPSISIAT